MTENEKSTFLVVLLLTLLFIMLTSCNPQPQGETKTPSTKYGDFVIKEIDGCEYLEYQNGIFMKLIQVILIG